MDEYCNTTVLPLSQTFPLPTFIDVNVSLLMDVCREFEKSESTDAKYSQPMVVIGCYIGVVSFICLSAMMLDLCLGINRLLFPSKLFSLNAASLTVIAVAIKLPMDLSSSMPYLGDQVAKLGGLSFLCAMMSHFMPSVGSTDNKSLISNLIALSITVVTLIVNVGIQLKTGVILQGYSLMTIACIYMSMLLFLLLIFISSSLSIPSITEILESKYQDNLSDLIQQENIISTLEELRQLVKRYWIMAQTGNPQFVMASSPLSFVSGLISTISMTMHLFLVFEFLTLHVNYDATIEKSVYAESVVLILLGQTVGIIIGSVAPILRCSSILKFKLLANHNVNRSSVFEVERYWTKKMCDMDHFYELRSFIKIGLGFHKVTWVSCEIMELISIKVIIILKCISYYFKSLQARLSTPSNALTSDVTDEDLSKYALLLKDDVPIGKYLVKKSLFSLRFIILVAQEKQRNNLLKLLEKSVAFDGVETFDTNQIQSLLPIEPANSWSLPIISLTCIAITIWGIDNDEADNLFRSVREGIFCTSIVEKSLYTASELVNIRRAATALWLEVKYKRKWLDTKLERSAYVGKTPTEIVKLFAHIAEEIISEFKRSTNGGFVETDNLPMNVIAANSMYRITQTIMHTYERNNLEIVEDELFARLSVMIADILSACLTNMPRVILTKCKENAIEKREDSVRDAAELLERTSNIIQRLETCELPSMDNDKMAFIDEWRLHLRQP